MPIDIVTCPFCRRCFCPICSPEYVLPPEGTANYARVYRCPFCRLVFAPLTAPSERATIQAVDLSG